MGHEFPRHDFHLRPPGPIDVGGTAEKNQCFGWEDSTRRFGNRPRADVEDGEDCAEVQEGGKNR